VTEAGYDRGALQLVRNLSGGITDMSGGITGIDLGNSTSANKHVRAGHE
jgi:hypothetical protein